MSISISASFSKIAVRVIAILGAAFLLVQVVNALPDPLGAPDLKTEHDSGISNTDNLTQHASGTYLGSCVTGDTIKLYADNNLVAQGTCTNNSYALYPSSPLSDGQHNITVTATDSEGESSHSPVLNVTIDTEYPVAPSRPDLIASSDTGRSSTDNDTRDSTPTFTGTCTTGLVVTLRRETDFGETTCTQNGTYTITITVSYENNNDTIAWQTDAAGNIGTESPVLNPNFDFTPPAIPSKPDLVAASDSGRSNTDNITNDTTPAFSGTCEYSPLGGEPYFIVSVRMDGEVVGEGECSLQTSTYSITTASQSTGIYDIDTLITDNAGNTSDPSDTLLAMKIDTTAAAPSVNGNSGNISAPSFSVSGNAEANSIITVSEGNTQLMLCFSSGNGNWGCNIPTPNNGSHDIDFRVIDIAGNTSSATTRTYIAQ